VSSKRTTSDGGVGSCGDLTFSNLGTRFILTRESYNTRVTDTLLIVVNL
jgi:hypothetical protein